jgi:hypothetical protein
MLGDVPEGTSGLNLMEAAAVEKLTQFPTRKDSGPLFAARPEHPAVDHSLYAIGNTTGPAEKRTQRMVGYTIDILTAANELRCRKSRRSDDKGNELGEAASEHAEVCGDNVPSQCVVLLSAMEQASLYL